MCIWGAGGAASTPSVRSDCQVTLPFLESETNSSVEKGVSPLPTCSLVDTPLSCHPPPCQLRGSSRLLRGGQESSWEPHTIFRERTTHRGVCVCGGKGATQS